MQRKKKRRCEGASKALVQGFSKKHYSVIVIVEKHFRFALPSRDNAFWERVPTDSTVADSLLVYFFLFLTFYSLSVLLRGEK